jgi:hypothetical protein
MDFQGGEIIDLTTDSPESQPKGNRSRQHDVAARTSRPSNQPIGVDICADLVDLVDEQAVDLSLVADGFKHKLNTEKPTRQTHPQKIREASKKRKRELAAAAKKAQEELQLRQALERARTQQEMAKQERELRRAKGMQGVNFIIIDDSSDEDAGHETFRTTGPAHYAAGDSDRSGQARAAGGNLKQPPLPRPKPSLSTASTATVKEASGGYFNFLMTNEDAASMQERMFQEAAEKMRSQNLVQNTSKLGDLPIINAPMPDIAQRYPEHWNWKDPYACLGLPEDASLVLVKAHYRALARRYHPDKTKQGESATKFHGIARAYRKLTERNL